MPDQLVQDVRGVAYAIIEGKVATYYAIASGLVRIIQAIIGDQRCVLTVSNPVGPGKAMANLGCVWLSMPWIVCGAGILLSPPLDLAAGERDALGKSAEIVRAAWNGIH